MEHQWLIKIMYSSMSPKFLYATILQITSKESILQGWLAVAKARPPALPNVETEPVRKDVPLSVLQFTQKDFV